MTSHRLASRFARQQILWTSRALALGGAALFAPLAADAGNSFSVSVEAGGVTNSATENNLPDFIDLGLDSTGYASFNPNYSVNAPANVNIDFRGLPMRVNYPTSGPGLVYSIPKLGFSRTFDAGLTRRENEDALVDFLETDQDGILSRILGYFVQETATDPVAGNPASLQSSMIAADFSAATGLGPGNQVDTNTGQGEEGRRSVYGIGARLGQYSVDGNDITTIDLPLTFVRPLSDPRYAIIIDLPLTFVETNGSQSAAASLGVGLRVPIFEFWTITPMVRAGATGSVDLGSIAALYSGSLASSLKFDWGTTQINIGNMISYIETADLGQAVDDFEINYNLQNTVTRNGVGLSGPLGYNLFGQDTTWEASVVNTQIFGDAVYVDNYTDLAVSLGTQASRNGITWDAIRLGFTYTVGNNGFAGGRVNFGYQF